MKKKRSKVIHADFTRKRKRTAPEPTLAQRCEDCGARDIADLPPEHFCKKCGAYQPPPRLRDEFVARANENAPDTMRKLGRVRDELHQLVMCIGAAFDSVALSAAKGESISRASESAARHVAELEAKIDPLYREWCLPTSPGATLEFVRGRFEFGAQLLPRMGGDEIVKTVVGELRREGMLAGVPDVAGAIDAFESFATPRKGGRPRKKGKTTTTTETREEAFHRLVVALNIRGLRPKGSAGVRRRAERGEWP